MRRLTLLLCLIVVAVLRCMIGSAEAATTTEQNNAVLPKTHVTLKAVNTGFEATPVEPSICAAGAAWIIEALLSAAIGERPNSLNTIPSRSNRRVELELTENVAGRMIEKPSSFGSGLIGRDESACNIA
jgi:hypothetical protein